MSRVYKVQVEIEYLFVPAGCQEEEAAYPILDLTLNYTPGAPATMYQRNGDPGDPGYSAEVDLLSVDVVSSDGLDLSDEARRRDLAQNYLDTDGGYHDVIEQIHEQQQERPE